MRNGQGDMRIPRGYLSSCRKHGIPKEKAMDLAEEFLKEKGRYPRTFGEALVGVCE